MPPPTAVPSPPPAKSAARAPTEPSRSMASVDARPDETVSDASTLDDLAGPAALSPGDADDLIARLADEQIDRLLADEDDGASAPATSPMPAPPAPPAIVAAAVPTPPTPILTTPIETTFVERRKPATEPAAAFPASFSPPNAKSTATDPPPTDAVLSTPPAAVAQASDSFAAVAAHDALRSDAAAVAAELAADLARSPARLAAPPAAAAAPSVSSSAASRDDSPSAIGRAVHAIGVVPTAIVDVINLPVRAANDAAREVIGAVAIVTLANAAALLLYLMIFR